MWARLAHCQYENKQGINIDEYVCLMTLREDLIDIVNGCRMGINDKDISLLVIVKLVACGTWAQVKWYIYIIECATRH